MSPLLFNLIFGLFPTLAFAWSLAADEQKDESDRVVVTASDERHHNVIFALVYGLWSFTLAMWNWMRGAAGAWIAFWLFAGVISMLIWRRLRMRASVG